MRIIKLFKEFKDFILCCNLILLVLLIHGLKKQTTVNLKKKHKFKLKN